MRIVQNTPERLILDDRPLVLGAILGLMIVVSFGVVLLCILSAPWVSLAAFLSAVLFGACFAAFVRRVHVIFDRAAGAVVIRTASIFGQTDVQCALGDLGGAVVEVTTSLDDHNSATARTLLHRPALQLAAGKPNLPLVEVYSAGMGADKVVAAINAWLSSR